MVVSALMSVNGNPAKILDLVTDGHVKICYSSQVLTEYIDVLNRPQFSFIKENSDSFIQGVQKVGLLSDPPSSSLPFIDEDDRCFYDVAVHCDAILVTGNMKHYPIEEFIVSPAEFLTIYKTLSNI